MFGIAAAAGDSIAQDVPAMAAVVDYLGPMVRPVALGPRDDSVDSPINEPAAIVAKSLADFQRVTEGTGVRFLPWLQDFTLYGVPYGDAEVKAQIDAAKVLGIDGFMLWNPNVRYHPVACTPSWTPESSRCSGRRFGHPGRLKMSASSAGATSSSCA